MQRTYSRKGSRRISRSAVNSPERSPEPAQPRKKRKIQVEVVAESSATDEFVETGASSKRRSVNSESRRGPQVASTSTSTQPPDPGPSKRNPRGRTSLTKSKDLDATTSTKPSPSSAEGTLTALLDASQPLQRLPLSSSKTTGVAKRMLRRTRTDSSVPAIGSSAQLDDEDAILNSPSPRKLLATRTESVIDLTFDSPAGSRSLSPHKTGSQSQEDMSSSPGKPARPSLASSNVRTYAGKSRSFLVALPNPNFASGSQGPEGASQDADDALLVGSQEDDIEGGRESYSDLRQRWDVDNSEDDPYPPLGSPEKGNTPALPPNMMNDLKSISELRSKGETRRFLDEMGYLFEGLNPSAALGVRRGSALEIVTKLCDEEFARRAKAADFLGKAWEVLRAAGAGDGDKVLDSVLAFFAALVARDPVDLSELLAQQDFPGKLCDTLLGLERANDPLWLISCNVNDVGLKKAGIARVEKTLLSELHKMIRKKSGLFPDSEIISSRLLISRALSLILPPSNDPAHISTSLRSLAAELKNLPHRVAAYASGLPLFPAFDATSHSDTVSLSHVDNCLRLLDTALLRPGQEDDDDRRGADILDAERAKGLHRSLVALCVAAEVMTREGDTQSHRSTAQRCLESGLRVLISLTHDNPAWCEGVLESDLTFTLILRIIATSQRQRQVIPSATNGHEHLSEDHEHDELSAALLDRLCLALGLLTNLVQVVEDVKGLAADTMFDLNCPGRRTCLATCRCPSSVEAITCLAKIYVQQCESTNDLDSVVRGHMAVLFGLFMQESPRNQRLLLDALPGASDYAKLGGLLEHARDFTSFYTTFTQKVAESQTQEYDDEEDEEGPLAQDGAVGRVLRDTKGETVAKNVIAFLEELRHGSSD